MQNTWVTERLDDLPSRQPKWLQGTHSDSAEEALAHARACMHTHTHTYPHTHPSTPTQSIKVGPVQSSWLVVKSLYAQVS